MEKKSCVLFCRCKAQIISSDSMEKISSGLKNFDTDVFELQDLCALTINEKDVLSAIGREFQQKIIIACYPRAIKNMFRQNEIDFGDFDVLNFRELSPEKLFSKLENEFRIPKGEACYQVQITDLDVPAWFPVIDESLCTVCGKCARFCLFGVYSYDKKSLNVVDPLACKDNCPACGRTCPTSAIIFPRLAENTVLAGDEHNGKKVAIDKGSLLTTLNARNQNRRNIFRQGLLNKLRKSDGKRSQNLKWGWVLKEMIKRILKNTDKRCLYKFVYNMGVKGSLSFARYQNRLKKGDFFPAFHFISVTDDCNLNCQGCWVTHKKKNARMEPETLNRIIEETKAKGSYFFGILGGEPLIYKPLFEVLKKHPDCYFQLFTNGTLLTPEVAEELRKLSNVTPLISFEGDEAVADVRRRGKNVYRRTIEAVENATKAGLITGVAMSVCKSNIDLALSPDFINSLIQKNVAYLWYYIYRPVGADSTVELALDKAEIQKLRQFMVNARSEFDIAIIDAYWDQNGNGLCPAATGLSHHINASGFVEPCPVIQFAAENVGDKPLENIYKESVFLEALRNEIPKKTSGCVIMEDPKWLVEMTEKYKAQDTSGRENEAERLKAMAKVPSHGSGTPVPEKGWIYRFAKKRAFFGLGAYG